MCVARAGQCSWFRVQVSFSISVCSSHVVLLTCVTGDGDERADARVCLRSERGSERERGRGRQGERRKINIQTRGIIEGGTKNKEQGQGMTLWTLVQAIILVCNGFAVLHEQRFLEKCTHTHTHAHDEHITDTISHSRAHFSVTNTVEDVSRYIITHRERLRKT